MSFQSANRTYSWIRAAAMLALTVQLTACTVTSNVVSSTSSSQSQAGKHLSHVGPVQWSFFWGLIPSSNLPAACQDGSDMSKVRTVTKPGYIVISFLTLGIVVPQQMEWDCAQIVREPGQIGH